MLHTFKKSHKINFKKTEIGFASKDTLKYSNKCSNCTNIHNSLTTLHILPHPHAHTPAQTQNTQSPPSHTDPPSMQVDWIELQFGQPSVHNVRDSSAQGQSGTIVKKRQKVFSCFFTPSPTSPSPASNPTIKTLVILNEIATYFRGKLKI